MSHEEIDNSEEYTTIEVLSFTESFDIIFT